MAIANGVDSDVVPSPTKNVVDVALVSLKETVLEPTDVAQDDWSIHCSD
ncbi:hypothetical protein A2U01_0077253 [Trifolium medium]|uniref:Uncharacterized protein n=1 Tax=Trifolium medium TaxID=97028 RepID=A0A392T5E9_9FABA|nr:hypothetical protein [Trifolium medium]